MSRKKTVSPEDIRILKNQIIDEEHPGTVIRDFETLLAFIGPEGIEVSGTYHFLPQNRLTQLNARMTHPLAIDLKRPQQKSYPHINGLYLLLRASGMTCMKAVGRKQLLFLDEAVLASWRGLNLTERYFTLLEAWLLKGNSEILGERMGPYKAPMISWRDFFRRISAQGLEIAGNQQEESRIPYFPGLYNLALMELFGLISVQHGEPEDGKKWRIVRVHRTPFGDALLQVLLKPLLEPEYLFRIEDEIDADFGALQPLVQPFFPEWRKNLIIIRPEFQDGLYIFKVSLGKNIWRRMAIPGQKSFASLSSGILNSVDFDFDHLYQFSYQNRFGVAASIHHPFIEESPWADKVRIGEIGLIPGTTITFLYDFGDNWEFEVTLERIDPPDPKIKKPVVLESHGEAPEQYPSWDDEEDDDGEDEEGEEDDWDEEDDWGEEDDGEDDWDGEGEEDDWNGEDEENGGDGENGEDEENGEDGENEEDEGDGEDKE